MNRELVRTGFAWLFKKNSKDESLCGRLNRGGERRVRRVFAQWLLGPLGPRSRGSDPRYASAEIHTVFTLVREMAARYKGLDYLQVFMSAEPSREDLWLMEDDENITIMPPSDF